MPDEIPSLEVAHAVLARAFPNRIPTLQDAATESQVAASYWRVRGQQDVINHLIGLCAGPEE